MSFEKRVKNRLTGLLVIRFALAAAVFTFVLPGVYAGGQGGSRAGAVNADYLNTASEMPIVKEKITLEIVMGKNVNMGTADKIWFWKWAEKEMNIHFDVAQIEIASAREKVNLMLASNELPDIFFSAPGFSTTDIFQYGQKEKQFIPLNGLAADYAPNLTNYFEQFPSTKAQATCPDGNIYTLPGVNFAPQTYNCPRAWIHTGWLDNLGLKMPGTLDEFYGVLKAFRDGDPNGNGKNDEIPLAGGSNSMPASLCIISAAMGFPEPSGITPVVAKNGGAKLFITSPVYGEYLKYVNRLFSEGLLDNEYYTNTMVQIKAKGAELRVGVHADSAPFQMTPLEKDWSKYEALTPMTSLWNDTRMWIDNPEIFSGFFAITNACKYPEAAMRFADFFYTEKGAVYSYYGPPKDHPDLLGMHNGWYFNNTGAVVYDRPADFANDQDFRMGLIAVKGPASFGSSDFQTPIEKMAGQKFIHAPTARAWRDSMDIYVKPYQIPRYPVVYFDSELNDRVLELTSTISDYMTIMDARFITGAEPLDNIPGYLAQLKELGATELEKIYQDAYNVYQKNLGQ